MILWHFFSPLFILLKKKKKNYSFALMGRRPINFFLLCGDHNGGNCYVRVGDCIASHILLPIMETKEAPLSKLAVEMSYPKSHEFKAWMGKRSCLFICFILFKDLLFPIRDKLGSIFLSNHFSLQLPSFSKVLFSPFWKARWASINTTSFSNSRQYSTSYM